MERKNLSFFHTQEFIALREWIEDMEDLLELREAKRADGGVPGRPLEEVAKDLGL
jgi:hypothetical protein